MRIASSWKAVVGGVAAALASLGTALQDGVLTSGEGLTAVAAGLAAAGLTWFVPNRAAETSRQ
ncbi:hypothetical protein [Streptomyces sp. NPDC005281]|uniref:hypothetical protein n=1 Tax=Streptomyces sp. NPDC005281 TaxID=3155712 RepID=UPI00339DFF53